MDLNVKLFEKNQKIFGIQGQSKSFFKDLPAKAQFIKGKIDKLSFIEIKDFALQKTLGETGRKYLQTTVLTKDLYLECMKNSQNSTVKNKPSRKWVKDMNKHFTEEDIQVAFST